MTPVAGSGDRPRTAARLARTPGRTSTTRLDESTS